MPSFEPEPISGRFFFVTININHATRVFFFLGGGGGVRIGSEDCMLQMERINVNLTELVCRFSPKEDIAPHRNKNISSCPVVCECVRVHLQNGDL